jgi:site-specific recombinase XerD
MANAGVAPELRQKLAGHSDLKSHAIYTHHELESLREAVAKVPGLKK